jgi:hypothetical protein
MIRMKVNRLDSTHESSSFICRRLDTIYDEVVAPGNSSTVSGGGSPFCIA